MSVGAGFVGLLAGLGFGELIALGTDTAYTSRSEHFFVTIMIALFLGVPTGLIYREIFLAKEKKSGE